MLENQLQIWTQHISLVQETTKDKGTWKKSENKLNVKFTFLNLPKTKSRANISKTIRDVAKLIADLNSAHQFTPGKGIYSQKSQKSQKP